MSDPAGAIQDGMAVALLADSAVTGYVGQAVLDELSAGNGPYPYVGIGDDQVIGEANGCSDGSLVYSTVHVYASGPNGRRLCKQIANAVRRVLSAPFAIDGHRMINALFQSARHMTDADDTAGGLVAHSVLVFQYRTLPTA
jgi:hypothetical protein